MAPIVIPPTLQAVIVELNSIGRIITARQWERAAYVSAYVTVSEQGVAKAKGSLSPAEFAAYGIHGLRSKDTVQRYVEAWRSTGRPRPKPGESIDPIGLPQWEKRTGGITSAEGAVRNIPGVVAKVLAKDPAFARKVLEQNPYVAPALTDALARDGHIVGLQDEGDPVLVEEAMNADPDYADRIADAVSRNQRTAAKVAAKVLKTELGQRAVAHEMVEANRKELSEAPTEDPVASFLESEDGKEYTRARKASEAREESLKERLLRTGSMDMNSLWVLLPPMYAFDEFTALAESVDYRVADDETRDTLRQAAARLRTNAQFLEDVAAGRTPTKLSDYDLRALLGG